MVRALLVAIAIAGCGDNLHAPDATGSAALQFTPCDNGLDCATLVVPADWSNPSDGATLSLPVVRAKARDAAQRIGVLTFNFGGPGGATLDPIVNDYPRQPIASQYDLTARFDFVVIDWRGVATSQPAITCLDTDTGTRLGAERFAPASDADWTQLFQLVTDIGAGCSANPANPPLLAHMDTESAARDFEALRVGLGEDTLNMWVVSYGTRIGAMYATLFPQHVRAIALDSPMFPAPQLETFLTTQGMTFEAELTRFFAWCAGTTAANCPFRTADGSALSVAAAYEALLTAADTAPIAAMGLTLDRPTIDLAATSMMYFPYFDWPALARALAALSSGDGSAMAALFLSNEIDGASDDNSFSAYQTVCAQDMPLPADIATPATFEAFAKTLDPIAPHVGLQNAAAQAFAVSWPATVPAQHAIGPATGPAMLITATRNDPATSYAWAGELQQAFANGSYLVTYEGDGHANAGFDACIGDVTAQFLLDPTTAPTVTDCPAIDPTDGMSRSDRVVHIPRPHFGRAH